MLQLDHLCAGYDGAERLHQVSAEIAPGRLTAVIGPNGCGKSTLIKCMAGLLPVSAGAVRLNGRELCAFSEKERARLISYMPQSRIAPDVSVRQLAAHGRYPHLKWGQSLSREDHEIIDRALDRAGMLPYANRLVSRLSGGERQRAYLAMMLAQQTPVMLLDEPTTYLDLSGQFSLMELLRGLSREGRSAVAVLHDLSLALEYADHILLMQDGRLIAEGTPEEVFLSGRLQEVFCVDIDRIDPSKFVFYRRRQEVSP